MHIDNSKYIMGFSPKLSVLHFGGKEKVIVRCWY